MRSLRLSAAAAALFVALGLPGRAAAQAVTCKDGTSSSQTGRGACSHHGGVASVAIDVTCRDGTTAAPGRGACSHHGGVGAPKTSRVKAATHTRTTEPSYGRTSASARQTVTCRDGTASTSGRGACSHHGGVEAASAPAATESDTRGYVPAPAPARSPGTAANATARCNDGTYSYAKHHTGACSHHGGVQTWYSE